EKLGVEVSRCSESNWDLHARSFPAKRFNDVIHGKSEVCRGSDADRTLFGCPRRPRPIGARHDDEHWKSDTEIQPPPHSTFSCKLKRMRDYVAMPATSLELAQRLFV